MTCRYNSGLFVVGLLAFGRCALAVTPFGGPVQTMEVDHDTYTPTGNNLLFDPNVDGVPPGAQASDPGGAPDFIPGEDWFDARNGNVGVVEEVPNGHKNNLGAPVSAPDGSGH